MTELEIAREALEEIRQFIGDSDSCEWRRIRQIVIEALLEMDRKRALGL